MTGGVFGSLFAQFFHLSSAERKTLLVAGAASGMSAVFATPVAAVLLAVELLLFEWKPRSFIPLAIAAIVASVLRVPFLGAGPIFPVLPHSAMGANELLAALLVADDACVRIRGRISEATSALDVVACHWGDCRWRWRPG